MNLTASERNEVHVKCQKLLQPKPTVYAENFANYAGQFVNRKIMAQQKLFKNGTGLCDVHGCAVAVFVILNFNHNLTIVFMYHQQLLFDFCLGCHVTF